MPHRVTVEKSLVTMIRIEGCLAGDAVDALRSAVGGHDHPVILDLRALLNADEDGIQTLREMRDESNALLGARPYVAALLRERS